jgi:hypothetical protein
MAYCSIDEEFGWLQIPYQYVDYNLFIRYWDIIKIPIVNSVLWQLIRILINS